MTIQIAWDNQKIEACVEGFLDLFDDLEAARSRGDWPQIQRLAETIVLHEISNGWLPASCRAANRDTESDRNLVEENDPPPPGPSSRRDDGVPPPPPGV